MDQQKKMQAVVNKIIRFSKDFDCLLRKAIKKHTAPKQKAAIPGINYLTLQHIDAKMGHIDFIKLLRVSFRATNYLVHNDIYGYVVLRVFRTQEGCTLAHNDNSFNSFAITRSLPAANPILSFQNCVVRHFIPGKSLDKISNLRIRSVEDLYQELIFALVFTAQRGIIHGNIKASKIILHEEDEFAYFIDFSKSLKTEDHRAQSAFERDVDSLNNIFITKFDFQHLTWPRFGLLDRQEQIFNMRAEQHIANANMLQQHLRRTDSGYLSKEEDSEDE